MNIFQEFQHAFSKHKEKTAFFIRGKAYTYTQFADRISRIRKAIAAQIKEQDKIIGLVTSDHIDTYASIIALWMEGKAYVPVNPNLPVNRNENILEQADVKTLMGPEELFPVNGRHFILTEQLAAAPVDVSPKACSDEEMAYILFTSGTTGFPKGVPITRKNLSAFIWSFNQLPIQFNSNDRYLQMFEFTFDLSVMSYILPLLNGACIYTIPKDKIKYNYVVELLEEHGLTILLLVPSTLHYLRPYLEEIKAPQLRYSMFCGEAIHTDILSEWQECIPNAEIYNIYGPTEHTVVCTAYQYKREGENKAYNGVLSVGKVMPGTTAIIMDESGKLLPSGEMGELCLAGNQLTKGYWKNEEKNKEAFFIQEWEAKPMRFYRTGDLCVMDKDGDILYHGRKDNQVKVQGFRIELSEVEFHAKSYLQKINAVALAINNAIGNTELYLVIEAKNADTNQLKLHMKKFLPEHMIPTQINFLEEFPLNINGKIDRNKIKELIK